MLCRAAHDDQAALVGADPDRSFVPPYVGKHGWIAVRLTVSPRWQEIEELVTASYRLAAPKSLARSVYT